MTLSLQDIPKIDKDRQWAVYGYIRNYEKVNQISIPTEIILVLILFYGDDTDVWDPKCISPFMKLSGRTLTQVKPSGGSSYGKRIIDSGIFKWRLKINECKKDGFILGIRRVGDDKDAPATTTWFKDGGYDKGYGFYSMNECLTGRWGYASGREYGINPPNGSTIEMVLDLDDLSLTYIINGKDYGKAYDVQKGEYRLALYLEKRADSLTLL